MPQISQFRNLVSGMLGSAAGGACSSEQTASSTIFSCDLLAESQKHILFLRELHVRGVSLKQPSLLSLDRYLNNWLPLVASLQHSECRHDLIPPADVAWLWHCHRMAASDYHSYVRSRFRMVLEPTPAFAFQAADGHNEDRLTQDAWEDVFPDVPFFLQEESEELKDVAVLVGGSFDVIGATQRQQSFLWQVSRPIFEDPAFLDDAIARYHKFLCLKPSAWIGSTALVPTLQIDLMWHTHILVSLQKYQRDCVAIRGERFYDNDESFDYRMTDATMSQGFLETSKLWKEAYGEEYLIPGAMYRGTPPASYFDGSWDPFASRGMEDFVTYSFSTVSGCTKSIEQNLTSSWYALFPPQLSVRPLVFSSRCICATCNSHNLLLHFCRAHRTSATSSGSNILDNEDLADIDQLRAILGKIPFCQCGAIQPTVSI
jgi:Glycine-rich domain-containing protein-like